MMEMDDKDVIAHIDFAIKKNWIASEKNYRVGVSEKTIAEIFAVELNFVVGRRFLIFGFSLLELKQKKNEKFQHYSSRSIGLFDSGGGKYQDISPLIDEIYESRQYREETNEEFNDLIAALYSLNNLKYLSENKHKKESDQFYSINFMDIEKINENFVRTIENYISEFEETLNKALIIKKLLLGVFPDGIMDFDLDSGRSGGERGE